MASGAERGLAQKLLAQRRSGSVSNDLAASARRVLDGQARAGDMEAIRAHFNVGRSYAGSIRGATGTVARIGGLAANVGRDLDLMSTGSSAAGARLTVNIAQTAAGEIVRNRRTLIKVGEGVAKAVGADPALASRFFNGLSRMAKLGGAVAGVAMLGFEIASNITQTMRAASEAGTRARHQADALMNRSGAVSIFNRAFGEAQSESVLGTTGLGAPNGWDAFNPASWYDDWVNAGREKNQADKATRMMDRVTTNRALMKNHGYVTTQLAKLAARKGVSIGDLALDDVNRVIDEVADRQIHYTSEEYLQHAYNRYNEMPLVEKWMFEHSDASRRARQNEWALEMNERVTERYKNRIEAKAAAEIETRRAMSATDRLRLQQSRDEASSGFTAYRSRHKPVILD